MIVYSGANDSDAEVYYQNIKKLIETDKKAKLLLLREETYSLTGEETHADKNWKRIVSFCELENVSCLDFPFAPYREAGNIWTDFVHNTSYGQKVFARKVISKIEKLLNDKP